MFRIQFIIILIILVGSQAPAQIASYPFEGNANDAIGNYDGISTGTVTYGTDGGRSYVSLAPASSITFPNTLNDVVYDESSFEFSFDFRFEDATQVSGDIELFSTSHSTPTFSFLATYFDGFGMSMRFLLSDGGENVYTVYDFTEGDTDMETWRKVNVKFNLELKRYSVSLGDILLQGAFDPAFDVAHFRQLLQDNEIRLIGYTNGAENSDIWIDSFSVYAPATVADGGLISSVFTQLAGDIDGTLTLTAAQKEAHYNTIINNLYFSDYEAIKSGLMTFTSAYESAFPPLYEDGIVRTFEALSIYEKLLQFTQGYVFQTQYVDGDLSHLEGVVFEHHKVAPGPVDPSAVPVSMAQVEVDMTYNRDIAAAITDQEFVVRPTGYYAAPGDIVTVRVPSEMINQGLSIIVGHHYRNLTYEELLNMNRFPDISAEYQITGSAVQIASPFGGGIYIKVPEGSNIGWQMITIEEAIKSPYFSWREGKHTDVSDWLQQVATTGAPWADFESDKKMFTVPVSKLAGITNPDAIMTRWDEIMDEIALLAGRPPDRTRAEYYTSDTRLVTPAYGAGYPMVIPISEGFRDSTEGWNPLTVLTVKPNVILLHEMGHNHLHPTLDYGEDLDPCHNLEAETIVHMLAVRVYSQLYGLTIDEALSESFWQYLDFYQSAFDWIITSNFRNGERMYEDLEAPMDDKIMLQYQARAWAKYADIAYLFGWDALADTNGAFYKVGEEQSSTVCDWRPFVVGRDEYIVAACEAVQVNMTPLFHFWGINPSPEVMAAMKQYPKSQLIKDRILEYNANVAPQSMADYMVYHNLFPTDDYQFPRYEYYLANFNTTEFTDKINAQFDYLIQTYFTELSDYTDIRSFSFSTAVNETIIDTVNHTVIVDVAKGTGLSNLMAHFTLSGGASVAYNGSDLISGSSTLNYNTPINLLVTAENGSTTQMWTVTVRERVGIDIAANAIEGPAVLCPGAGAVTYSVVGDPVLTDYNWSYTGTGVNVIQNGTRSVQLEWSSTATGGTLTVDLISDCGQEGIQSIDIVMGDAAHCEYYNCAVQELQLNNEDLSNRASIEVLRAINQINMSAQLGDSNLLYIKAGQVIELEQNMSVESGSSLIAIIEACQ